MATSKSSVSATIASTPVLSKTSVSKTSDSKLNLPQIDSIKKHNPNPSAVNQNVPTPNTDQNAVGFSGVTFAHKDGEEILRQVSFSLPKGSMTFLTGESGIGKSSLLHLIFKAYDHYLGQITIHGKDLSSLSNEELSTLRQSIGIVFQEFNLFDHLSVLDNVALPLTLRGEALDSARTQATELLSWLGLGSYLSKSPQTLSGGQRQRIAVARCVITNPDIILADEPTGHVDDDCADRIISLFKHLNEQGKTVIISTHNKGMVASNPFPQLHLDNGNIEIIEPVITKKTTKKIPSKKSTPKTAAKATTKTKAKASPKTSGSKTKKTALKEVSNG